MVLFVSLSCFAKDISSFPYEGKKTDFAVGIFGGTGCSRHWDIMDFHDYSHLQPADKCGKFVLVSPRHHKWVDMSEYGKEKYWWMVLPIHGDAILEKAKCDGAAASNIYRLVQYLRCGGEGHQIALCDEEGNDVSAKSSLSCH